MGTSTRKQREVHEREQRLMDVGRRLLIEQGFAGLSMDRLAEATEYSKGTVYQHFSTKEDLVAALAAQSSECRLALFQRAGAMVGRPRERITAMTVADELFARLHPHYFRSEMVIKMADLEDRAQADHLRAWHQYDARGARVVQDQIAEAVRIGDLALAPPQTEGDLIFGLFAQAIGSHCVMLNHAPLLDGWRLGPPFQALERNFQKLLDGYGMRPLSTEWDYHATRRRALMEVFADESRIAGLV